jgi:hypothetical protein
MDEADIERGRSESGREREKRESEIEGEVYRERRRRKNMRVYNSERELGNALTIFKGIIVLQLRQLLLLTPPCNLHRQTLAVESINQNNCTSRSFFIIVLNCPSGTSESKCNTVHFVNDSKNLVLHSKLVWYTLNWGSSMHISN